MIYKRGHVTPPQTTYGKKLVTILGIAFLAIGVLGFVPCITIDVLLFGIFGADAVLNVFYLLSGILVLVFADRGEASAKSFAKVFGIVYGHVAILGIIAPGTLNMIIHVNGAGNALHTLLAVVFLAIGYSGLSEYGPLM